MIVPESYAALAHERISLNKTVSNYTGAETIDDESLTKSRTLDHCQKNLRSTGLHELSNLTETTARV